MKHVMESESKLHTKEYG